MYYFFLNYEFVIDYKIIKMLYFEHPQFAARLMEEKEFQEVFQQSTPFKEENQSRNWYLGNTKISMPYHYDKRNVRTGSVVSPGLTLGFSPGVESVRKRYGKEGRGWCKRKGVG